MLSRIGVLVVLVGLALGGVVIAYVLGVFGPYDVVYLRGGVEVVYVGKPLLGNDTVLRVQVVDRGGRPLNVTVYATGPTLDGFVEVGRARAMGEAVLGPHAASTDNATMNLGYAAKSGAWIILRPNVKMGGEGRPPVMVPIPSRVYGYCVIGVESSTCYYWRYKSTVESGIMPIYIAMTYINPYDGDKIKRIYHGIKISILRQDNIYIDLTVGIGSITLPGPGWIIWAETGQTIPNINCIYWNSKLSGEQSDCNDGSQLEHPGTFYDGAIVGTGFRAQYEVAVYEYVEEDCFAGYCSTTVLDEHELYWVVPISVDGRWDGAWYIDGDPYDGVGLDPLWDGVTSGYTVVDADTGYGAVVGDWVANITSSSSDRVLFAFPIRVAGLAIELRYRSFSAIHYSVRTLVQAGPDKCADIKYRRHFAPKLYVEPTGSDAVQVSELVSLELAYYWPYTYSC